MKETGEVGDGELQKCSVSSAGPGVMVGFGLAVQMRVGRERLCVITGAARSDIGEKRSR